MVKPRFFRSPAQFRHWLEQHHDNKPALLVGFYKVGSGKSSMTWPQSVDEALCWGWIDGARRHIDDASYSIRFSPRKPTSNWSAVNIKRAKSLIRQGRMAAAGLEAFSARRENRAGLKLARRAPEP